MYHVYIVCPAINRIKFPVFAIDEVPRIEIPPRSRVTIDDDSINGIHHVYILVYAVHCAVCVPKYAQAKNA